MRPPVRVGRTFKSIFAAVAAMAGFVMLWQIAYSDLYDPKNIHYVGWKWHLLPMDPQRALNTMPHDSDSGHLVRGMTKEQLERRFGFVLTTDQVRPYLRDYCAAARPGSTVLFLNSADYMVVMQDGKATELVLCKD